MSKFEDWITKKLGYTPRQIDLANDLGEMRGEIVRKWYKGIAYPGKKSCTRLADYLDMPEAEVKKAILEIRIEDIES